MILTIPNTYKDDVNALRRTHFEVVGRKNILTYMLENGMKGQEVYENMWEEYLEYLSKYNTAKRDFTATCVSKLMEENNIPVTTQIWNIDFEKCELIISD